MTEAVIDYPRGITFEEVWAALKETDRQMKENAERQRETDRLMKENAKENAERQRETDRLMKENAKENARERAEWQRERAERHKEIDQMMKETDRQMKELGKKMGDLHNRFGEIAEHLVAPGIEKRFNELGHHFSGVAPEGYEIRDEQGKILAEVDILLENGKSIMVVEVKTRPRVQDVQHHVKRMAILREYRDKYGDSRRIYGSIAGAVFGRQAKKATVEAGFYAIEQSGDTMRITVPEGFIPKEW